MHASYFRYTYITCSFSGIPTLFVYHLPCLSMGHGPRSRRFMCWTGSMEILHHFELINFGKINANEHACKVYSISCSGLNMSYPISKDATIRSRLLQCGSPEVQLPLVHQLTCDQRTPPVNQQWCSRWGMWYELMCQSKLIQTQALALTCKLNIRSSLCKWASKALVSIGRVSKLSIMLPQAYVAPLPLVMQKNMLLECFSCHSSSKAELPFGKGFTGFGRVSANASKRARVCRCASNSISFRSRTLGSWEWDTERCSILWSMIAIGNSSQECFSHTCMCMLMFDDIEYAKIHQEVLGCLL